MAAVTIRTKGVAIRTFNLHLEAGATPSDVSNANVWASHWESIYRAYAQRVAESPSPQWARKVVLGDFNARMTGDAYQARFIAPFYSVPGQANSVDPLDFKEADGAALNTFPSAAPSKKVDYIFVPRSWAVSTRRPVVTDSDHLPLDGTLAVPGVGSP